MSKPMMDACRPIQVPPTAKAVLMVFAYQHHDGGELWPSLTFLEESTCLSRRAVIDAIKTLESCALVVADRSQPRRTVYTITPDAFQADRIPPSARSLRRADSAPAAPSDSAADTPTAGSDRKPDEVPDSAANALPVVSLPHQQEGGGSASAAVDSAPAAQRIVHLPPQVVHLPHSLVHLPHPNSKEQLSSNTVLEEIEADAENFQLDGSSEQQAGIPGKKSPGKKPKAAGFDPTTTDIPDWLNRELWCMWCRARKAKGKPITEDAARLQFKQLERYRSEGHTPQDVIEHAIASSNQGLFPPPTSKFQTRRASGAPHGGFSTVDYEKDLIDGRLPA